MAISRAPALPSGLCGGGQGHQRLQPEAMAFRGGDLDTETAPAAASPAAGCAGARCPGPWRGSRVSPPAAQPGAALRSPKLTRREGERARADARLHRDLGRPGAGRGRRGEGGVGYSEPRKSSRFVQAPPGKARSAAEQRAPRLRQRDPGGEGGDPGLPRAGRAPLHPTTLAARRLESAPEAGKAGLGRCSPPSCSVASPNPVSMGQLVPAAPPSPQPRCRCPGRRR
uniref:Uncharacterized protein n=1 Tax=Rangifer tarandus platyrhynchus TaxID=3082113 RepID=A0ACB0EM01_RANTA|nr:unnamed protein product [Rangifer tarandus platyrhynchus]